MNIIANKKTEEPKSGGLAGVLDQISGLLGGDSTSKDEDGVEFIIQRLGRFLDNNFTLLSDYPLHNLPVEIPIIIIGPPGVQVIIPNTQPGIFQAKDDGWYEMNDRKQKFELAKENLIKRTIALAGGVQEFLEECGVNLQEIAPVMLFSNAGSHIDTSNPAIRIVPRDALDKYATGLMQAPPIIKKDAVLQIANLITRPSVAKTQIAKVKSQSSQPEPETEHSKPAFEQDSEIPTPAEEPVDQQTDGQSDWMKAIAEPEIDKIEEVTEEKDQLSELMDKWSPAKTVSQLGFSNVQWLVLAGISGIILMTIFVAILLLLF